MDGIHLAQDIGSCEYGSELSSYIKCEKLPD